MACASIGNDSVDATPQRRGSTTVSRGPPASTPGMRASRRSTPTKCPRAEARNPTGRGSKTADSSEVSGQPRLPHQQQKIQMGAMLHPHETAMGRSGIVGGGSSATGARPTNEDARSGGEMARARPSGSADATPGAVRLQGGTNPASGDYQRHAEGGVRAPEDSEIHGGANTLHAPVARAPTPPINWDAFYDSIPPRTPSPPADDDDGPQHARPPPDEEDKRPMHHDDHQDGDNHQDDGLPFANGIPPDRPPTPLDQTRTFPGPPRRHAAGGRRKKSTKASIQVCALNIHRIGNPNPWHPKHKWYHVNQLSKEYKSGVMILGESHLNALRHANIQALFGRRLEVIFSEDPVSPNAKGVAFVINKELVDTDNIRTWEIVPGRAMLLEVETHKGEKMVILGIYTPNMPLANAAFWKKLHKFFIDNPTIPKPDIMGGDTNVVEEPIDRLPSRADPEAPTAALDLLLTSLKLVDGWRKTNPDTKAYTYIQSRRNIEGGLAVPS
ncbi:hypothetical protein B0H17DRAFT_1213689 [Mycena rosella]|uniref:DNase I-like protein n=1 Tax=Mycena rosella TaxID=1033263 RepID=A0AAD7G168_MYCRO|nr:hypothetical protein B0H17DRAFT_1213689 [Mycena rosella]